MKAQELAPWPRRARTSRGSPDHPQDEKREFERDEKGVLVGIAHIGEDLQMHAHPEPVPIPRGREARPAHQCFFGSNPGAVGSTRFCSLAAKRCPSSCCSTWYEAVHFA